MASQVIPACCGELSCSREQPIEPLRRVDKDGTVRWFAVTQHRDIGPDGFESMQKHELRGEFFRLLEDGYSSQQQAEAHVPAPAAPRKPSNNPQLSIDHLSGQHLSPVAGCSRCAESRT